MAGNDAPSGVGETALGAALLRAEESSRPNRLFEDPYAAAFVAAAPPVFADGPEPGDPQIAALREALSSQLAIRTRFYDDYLVASSSEGCNQVVLLGAGLDTRAYRLDWPDGVRVFELDFPAVFAFKDSVLAATNAIAHCHRTALGIDLSTDWTNALLETEFRPEAQTAWTAEGLLSYLSNDEAIELLTRVGRLSSIGSQLAIEAARIGDDATLIEARETDSLAPVTRMWRGGLQDDPAVWLGGHGWVVAPHDRADLARRYGRPIADPSTGGFLVARRR